MPLLPRLGPRCMQWDPRQSLVHVLTASCLCMDNCHCMRCPVPQADSLEAVTSRRVWGRATFLEVLDVTIVAVPRSSWRGDAASSRQCSAAGRDMNAEVHAAVRGSRLQGAFGA